MAADRNDYRVAIDALKDILRAQKLTYRDIAKALGLSESGVKKIFSAEDGSFQRISQICRLVGTTLPELFQGLKSEMTDFTFSIDAQEFLLKNPRAFAIYWRLVYERMELSSAQKMAKLDDKEAFKILRQLDDLGLITLLPEGKVKVPPVQQIRWVGSGPLIEKLYREWGGQFLQSVAKPDLEAHKLFLIRYMKVFPKTYEDLVRAQRELEVEFVRRGIQDMRTGSPALVHLRWVAGIDDSSFMGS